MRQPKQLLPVLLISGFLLSSCTFLGIKSKTGTTQTATKSSAAGTIPGTVPGTLPGTSPTQTGPSGLVEIEELEALTKEFEQYKSEKTAEITALNEEIAALKNVPVVTPDNSALAFKDRLAGLLYFPMISLSPENYEEEILAYVAIPPQKSVEEKVDRLAEVLSALWFNYSPMETTIVETNGVKTLNVNLVGRSDWDPKFAGSTGGAVRSHLLIETFLQRDYKNAWIDAVAFTVDNTRPAFEHAPGLDETSYR